MMAYKAEDRPLPEELLEDPWFATPVVDAHQQQQQHAAAEQQHKKVLPLVQQKVGGAAEGPPYSAAGSTLPGN